MYQPMHLQADTPHSRASPPTFSNRISVSRRVMARTIISTSLRSNVSGGNSRMILPARDVDQQPMLLRRPLGQVAVRAGQLNTDHQAPATNRPHVGMFLQLHAQARQQVFALACGIFEQALLLDNLQHRTPDATRQRVAAKGAAMAAWGEQLRDGGAGQAGADGHAIAEAWPESSRLARCLRAGRQTRCRCARCRSGFRRASSTSRGVCSARAGL